jgi:enoyl-CoA hydratase/carnithine racemase
MIDVLLLARAGPIAILTLNRPDKRNALTAAMWRALPEQLADLAGDPEVLSLIVTGAGAHFAGGAAVQVAGAALAAFPKPTLAQIRGACVGGGCGLALACDLRFADDTARLGITPGKLGLAYTLADTKRLVDAVGPAAAKDILFSGRLVDAREAYRLRLVDRVVAPDALDATVREYLNGLAAVSQFSIRAMKATISAIQAGQTSPGEADMARYLDGFRGEDFQEGYSAFLAKRPPRFTFR